MNKSDIQQNIIEASENRTLTFFVGAGVSAVSKVPTWHDLITCFCKQMNKKVKDVYSQEDYLSIPQIFYYSYVNQSKKRYYQFIKRALNNGNSKPNKVHTLMFAMNPQCIVTTNFDTLLEEAAVQNCVTYHLVAEDKEVTKINGEKYILKVHGDLEHKNVVLKEEDYLNYSDNFKLIETVLKTVFATNIVVFIGYGLNDYNIKTILNWTKMQLKDRFRNPIFLYTGSKKLSDFDLKYHCSRGLSIIDAHDFFSMRSYKAASYEDKYCAMLRSLLRKNEIERQNKAYLFKVLYDKLLPLDKLDALRMSDVSERLVPHHIIDETGYIRQIGKISLLKLFCDINSKTSKKMNYDIDRYNLVCNVFCKARIRGYIDEHKYIVFSLPNRDYEYEAFLNYSFKSIEERTKTKATSYKDQLSTCYSWYLLGDYIRSYRFIKKVIEGSFKEKDYVAYFFSQSTRKRLYNLIKNNMLYYDSKIDFDEDEILSLDKQNDDRILDQLPISIKEQYSRLFEVYSPEFFSNYVKNVITLTEKIGNTINSEVYEYGITSTDKAIYQIQEIHHFVFGNHLILETSENLKMSIINLVKLIIAKISDQGKQCYNTSGMRYPNNHYSLNYVDFFCIIEYFKSADVDNLMSEYNIKAIQFSDMARIETNVISLFSYYEKLVMTNSLNSFPQILHFQKRIYTCLCLLRYVNISSRLFEYVTKFILQYEFRDMDISKKYRFLRVQIDNFDKDAAGIRKYIIDKLLEYISLERKFLLEGKVYTSDTRNSYIDYYDLSDCLGYKKRTVVKRLSEVIDSLISEFVDFPVHKLTAYYKIVSEAVQKRIVDRAYESLTKKYNMDLFFFLHEYNIEIPDSILITLRTHIYDMVSKSNNSEVYVLDTLGFWCFQGIIDKNLLTEYKGLSKKMDFYAFGDTFDYNSFEIRWLFDMNVSTHNMLKNKLDIKRKICDLIIAKLRENNLCLRDTEKLQELFMLYSM